ncbi:GGDEF domain-containing protein [Cetobacterium somerae]|uniref:transporter substrate-binding domain-containing diguanylate cyclase n=1 Tax=Cetobacterium somerae TaxID=188913 RepID=UPI00225AB046|nr:GGDEF domain-containing protein [Cetobacterium somerae]MCX3065991.1 GGDEF domain-containing protein [Cetobacterium somerae]
MKFFKNKSIKLLLFLLIATTIFSNDNTFYLGIQSYPETEMEIDGVSINNIIRDIFKNELKLNVKEVHGTWRDSYNQLEDGTIGALGLVTKDSIRKDNILLSKPIFSENLYIASDKKLLKSPYDLMNQTIYAYKDDEMPIKYLKEYLEQNNITANIVEVENIDDYKNDFYLDSEFIAVKSQNRLLVSFLAPVCIGVNKKYDYLLPYINNALNKKYSKKISTYFKNLPLYHQRERFQNSLTKEEKEFLAQKKFITTSLEDDISLSIYIKNQDKFIGILPQYVNKLASIINIPIKYIYNGKEWLYIQEKFKQENIDFLTLSTTARRKSSYIFSEAIDFIPMHLLNHVDSGDYNVGVLKDGKSQDIGKDFFPEEDIRVYNSTTELFNAFKKDEIGYIISPYNIYDRDCHKQHKDIKIKDIPVNFAFSKNQEMLRNIFNKAIAVVGDFDRNEIRNFVETDQKEYVMGLIEEAEHKKKIWYIFTLVFGLLICKIVFQRKLTKALTHDQLTKLPNRYLFNEFCKKNDNTKGAVIVIDLDNFKKTNDNYGHSKGDLVLSEVGKLLLEVFSKEHTFRISGDEFYLFYENRDLLERLEKLVTLGKNSTIINQYNISFSIGYYIKNIDETLELAFEKADIAMYDAKKLNGFSIMEYKK